MRSETQIYPGKLPCRQTAHWDFVSTTSQPSASPVWSNGATLHDRVNNAQSQRWWREKGFFMWFHRYLSLNTCAVFVFLHLRVCAGRNVFLISYSMYEVMCVRWYFICKFDSWYAVHLYTTSPYQYIIFFFSFESLYSCKYLRVCVFLCVCARLFFCLLCVFLCALQASKNLCVSARKRQRRGVSQRLQVNNLQ